jgi:protein CMS1
MGAPHTIIVTASGIRAADLCRSLKSGLPKEGVKDPNVAKLFAKHMKLAEQVTHLKKNKYVVEVVNVKKSANWI